MIPITYLYGVALVNLILYIVLLYFSSEEKSIITVIRRVALGGLVTLATLLAMYHIGFLR